MASEELNIHASEIGPFFKCPFKWLCKQRNIKPEVTTTDKKADLGKFFHELIADYFRSLKKGETLRPEIIEKLLDASYKNRWAKAKIPHMGVRASRCIKNLVEIEKKRLKTWPDYNATFVEKTFTYENLTGTVDFYSEPAKTIIDWKTNDVDYITDSMLLQGSIYKYMLEKSGYSVDRVYFALLFPGLFLEMPPTTEGWLKDNVTKMVDIIAAKDFKKIKSGLCKVCEYKTYCESTASGRCLWSILL